MNDICQGNSIHECLTCDEPYFCYNCPDPLNPTYSEGMCEPCLQKMLGIDHNIKVRTKVLSNGAAIVQRLLR